MTATAAASAWRSATAGLLAASPANPTGTWIDEMELARRLALAHTRSGFAIVDEIYLGLWYDKTPATTVELFHESVVTNRFFHFRR